MFIIRVRVNVMVCVSDSVGARVRDDVRVTFRVRV